MKALSLLTLIFACNFSYAYNCVKYTKRAIAQQKAAVTLGCGYTGVRWATTAANHYAWCSSVPLSFAVSEDLARQQGLEACLQPVALNNCNVYAFRAVHQYKASLNLGCGFSGLRWQANAANHKAFCVASNFAAADSEDQARINALDVCIAN